MAQEGICMKVVLAGGSGTLGTRIAASLAARGDEVVILTRSPDAASPYRQVCWDGRTLGPWASEISGAAVINLAGELVDRRPTRDGVELLMRSRVEPTRALVEAADRAQVEPTVWLQASTLAIYGDGGDRVLDEDAQPGDGPSQHVNVALAWEAAAAAARARRLVVLRIGIVLDRDTPVLDRLGGLVRWCLGGRIGSGRQWVSWLHIDDFLAIVEYALDRDEVSGVFNATGPRPVRNQQFMAELRHGLGRPLGLPAPETLVRMGSVLLRTDPALALTGRRCVPRRLQEAGFVFRHPDLRSAFAELLATENDRSSLKS
jgi:uncharacterized protein